MEKGKGLLNLLNEDGTCYEWKPLSKQELDDFIKEWESQGY
jgi:hypothetical protein